jgi:hypothetical protein
LNGLFLDGDSKRGISFEAGQDLSDLLGVEARLVGLGFHEIHDWDSVRPADHQGETRITDHPAASS